jgi:glycoside/pentoside/hexuronide:cation symporter, GPH family
MSFTIGILLAFGGIQFAMNAEDARAAAAWLALPAAIVAGLLLAVTPLVLREPERSGTSGGRGLVASFRDVVSTSAARRLLGVQFIQAAGVGAVGTMGPYIAEYLLRRPDAVGLIPASYVISGVVSIPFWVLISRRLGQRQTWMMAMLLAASAFAGIWFVGAGDIALLVSLLVVAGAAMGCGGVLSNTLLADVIDLDARRTGERKEGVYSAAMLLALKVGTAMAVTASGPVMTTAGFTPNVEQTEASLMGLRILFAGMPCLGFLIGAWLFRGFSLDGDGPPAILATPVPARPRFD